jgi:hypothetical protein
MGQDRNGTRVVMTEVADGAFLLDEASGTFYHLNPAGALAYGLLRTGKHTVSEVADAVAEAFATDRTATLTDVRAFVADLARHGLVEPWA